LARVVAGLITRRRPGPAGDALALWLPGVVLGLHLTQPELLAYYLVPPIVVS
jgi:hypothetical protein